MSEPLVSVIMPAYNAAPFIGAAIESMQEQHYENWQLCIVDDGSTDNTHEVAQSYLEDPRICLDRIFHAGCPSARNAAHRMAEGSIIAKLDADDTHEPERLLLQVAQLLNTDDEAITCEMNWLKDGKYLAKRIGGMNARAYMAGTSRGPVCASIVTWQWVYDKVGYYMSDQLAGSDGDWNFRAICKHVKWGHIPEFLYNQRRHSQQLSQTMIVTQREVHEASRKKYLKQWRTGL